MARDEGSGRRATDSSDVGRWRPHLPRFAFALVIVCVAALAVTPLHMIGRLRELRRDTDATAGAATSISSSLRLIFSQEIAAHEAYRMTHRPESAAEYRLLRAEEERAFDRLFPLAREVGVGVAARAELLRDYATRLHAASDARVDGLMSEQQFEAALPRLRALHDSLQATQGALDSALAKAIDADHARGAGLLVEQRRFSIGMGALSLVAILLVGWFARRDRVLHEKLERSVREEALRREELERLTDSRDRLMRGFTHDVKNPIGAADGYLQLLDDEVFGPLGGRQRDAVHKARAALTGALALIGDLLELAQTRGGDIAVHYEPTDIRRLAREAAEEYRAQAEAKGLALAVDADAEVPTVRSDPQRVRQVLSNLISNAVKYTPHGEVRISVAAPPARRSDDDRSVVVAVSDTGPGIPVEQQPLVFEEFVRLDPHAAPGAGIGLAISRHIVHALGGDLRMASEAGRGSTFALELPVTRTEPAA